MTQRSWPAWVTKDALVNVVQQMLGTREEDINDYFNLPNQFIAGRRVQKIPTSSADYDPITDNVGDVSYDLNYFYILVQNGSSAAWRRIALGSW